MKLILTIILFVIGVAFMALDTFGSLGSLVTGNVRLHWNYDAPASTNFSFNLYFTTNLTTPAAQWPLLTNIVSTTALDTNNVSGTNYVVDLTLPPAQYFFVATITNFWGESSITSNIVSTPPAPQPVNTLQIKKLP